MALDGLFGRFKKELPGEKAAREADPTTFSPLPVTEPLKKLAPAEEDKRNVIFQSGGETYVSLHSRPELQRLVALSLKGIVNVSDVVPNATGAGPHYLSKVMPLDKIEQPHAASETQADLLVLACVFTDEDRSADTTGQITTYEGGNMRAKEGKTALYDFEEARQLLTEDMELGMRRVKFVEDPQALEILITKLDLLEQRYAGDEGLAFIKSVVAKTGKSVPELFGPKRPDADEQELQRNLLERIASTRVAAHARIAALHERDVRVMRAA